MALDQFVFGMSTLAHQELRRQSKWRHASNARVGARPVLQFVGPGDDTITLSGELVPELAGSLDSIKRLREMADAGLAYALVDGDGAVFGAYVILDIDETGTYLQANGKPRKVQFSLTLQRQADERAGSMAQTREQR